MDQPGEQHGQRQVFNGVDTTPCLNMDEPGEQHGQRQVFNGADTTPRFQLQQCVLPTLKRGEILGRILLATICGSDLHTIEGKRKELTPGVLGHEAVIEVIQSNRHGVVAGNRLSFSVADSCGSCFPCITGIPQKCHSLFKYGHALVSDESGWNGCYSTHILIRPGTHVAKIPNHVTDKAAAPANCALATAVFGVESISASVHNKTAFIQGAGLLGLYACALLKERGYEKVYCSDVQKERLKSVEAFGGIPVQAEVYNNIPEENSIDVVIEACGVKEVLKTGYRLLRPGGSYILIGLVHPDSAIDITAEQIIRKCLTIKGIHNYNPGHLDRAIQFLGDTFYKYPYETLVGQVFELDDLQSGIQMALQRRSARVALQPCLRSGNK